MKQELLKLSQKKFKKMETRMKREIERKELPTTEMLIDEKNKREHFKELAQILEKAKKDLSLEDFERLSFNAETITDSVIDTIGYVNAAHKGRIYTVIMLNLIDQNKCKV